MAAIHRLINVFLRRAWTGHPLAWPYKERGMNWIWCYLDKTLLDSPAT